MENTSVKRETDHNNNDDVKEEEGIRKRARIEEDNPNSGKLLVEVMPEDERFPRVLKLLEEWYEKGTILIFVKSDDQCGAVFNHLVQHGYPCLALHDNAIDVECTVSDFKTSSSSGNQRKILIATSVVSRVLDVKDLQLVINFDLPDIYKDYIHRLGRTESKGFTVTFVSFDNDMYAPDLLYALGQLNQDVPDDLMALGERYLARLKEIMSCPYKEEVKDVEENQVEDLEQFRELIPKYTASEIWHFLNTPRIQDDSLIDCYKTELEINDYSRYARWKVTDRRSVLPTVESTGVSIETMGHHVKRGEILPVGARKQYLLIKGHTQRSVDVAKAKLKRILEESTSHRPTSQPAGSSVRSAQLFK